MKDQKNTVLLEDDQLDVVFGGVSPASFELLSLQAAGLEIKGSVFRNKGVVLASSGESLSAEEADAARQYFLKKGHPAASRKDLQFFQTSASE